MEDSSADEASPQKDFTIPPPPSNNSSDYFDCNICLDFARDPVVTLCGHLYCCPCIHKWLLVEDDNISPQSCPVCKATLSQDSLVHLYGRGALAKRRQHRGHRHRHRGDEFSSPAFSPPRLMSSTAGGVLEEMAVAAAMRGGSYYSNRYHRDEGIGGSPRLRRQEMEVERRLNQMWLFMLCCAVLCLVLF